MAEDRPLDDPIEAIKALKTELADVKSTLAAWAKRRPVGTIEIAYRSAEMPGTLFLDGSAYFRESLPELWAWANDVGAVGQPGGFGVGDGSTFFTVPDWQGRVMVGVGALGSQTYALGDVGGTAMQTLAEAQMPSHTHTMGSGGSHGGHFPGSQYLAVAGADYGLAAWNSGGSSAGSHTHSIGSAGSGQAFDNRPPWVAAQYVIWA